MTDADLSARVQRVADLHRPVRPLLSIGSFHSEVYSSIRGDVRIIFLLNTHKRTFILDLPSKWVDDHEEWQITSVIVRAYALMHCIVNNIPLSDPQEFVAVKLQGVTLEEVVH